jgi:hypothetical protein
MDLIGLLLSFLGLTSFGVAAIVAVEGAVTARSRSPWRMRRQPIERTGTVADLPCDPCSAAA